MYSQQMSQQGFYNKFTDCETLLILRVASGEIKKAVVCMRRGGNTHWLPETRGPVLMVAHIPRADETQGVP